MSLLEILRKRTPLYVSQSMQAAIWTAETNVAFEMWRSAVRWEHETLGFPKRALWEWGKVRDHV